MHVGVLVDDDQGPLELAHVLGVDPEIGLQRDGNVNSLGHVHEGSAGPDGGVQCRELVVTCRDDAGEVFLEDLGMFLEGGVRVEEDHTLPFQLLIDVVVDHFGFVLGRDPRHETSLLRLGDAEPVVGVLDVLGQVIPGLRLAFRGTDEVLDVVEVDLVQFRSPGRHRFLAEQSEGLEAQVPHPLGFALQLGDVLDHGLVEPPLGGSTGGIGVVPAVLVAAEGFQVLVLRGPHSGGLWRGRHRVTS